MLQTYYVSVVGRSVLPEQGAAPYEWVIQATSEEVDELRNMLFQVGDIAEHDFINYVFPWPDTPEENANAEYSTQMQQVYREIYHLGTEETRQGMERLNMLNQFETVRREK